MRVSVDALFNAERLPQQVSRLVESPLRIQRPAEEGHHRGSLRMVLAIKILNYVQRLTVVAFGFGVMSPLALDGAEVYQILGDVGMALTVKFAIHRQYAQVQRVGNVEVSRIELGVRQFGQALGKIGVCFAGR